LVRKLDRGRGNRLGPLLRLGDSRMKDKRCKRG
jgi:hypothetical protein